MNERLINEILEDIGLERLPDGEETVTNEKKLQELLECIFDKEKNNKK